MKQDQNKKIKVILIKTPFDMLVRLYIIMLFPTTCKHALKYKSSQTDSSYWMSILPVAWK